jgi:transposase
MSFSEPRCPCAAILLRATTDRTVVLAHGLVLQDNAPIHNARVVDEWMGSNGVPRDQTFPPASPDLNLIESVWGLMAQRMMSTTIHSADHLLSVLREQWAAVTPADIQRLYGSWSSRLRAVVAANGAHTKY